MRSRRTLYIVLSLIVTIATFALLLREVEPGEVVQLVKNINRRALLAFFILSLCMSAFRTMRYQLLLERSGIRVQSSMLFLVVLVRNFFSDLLPARIGSTVYLFLVTKRLNVPFIPTLSSFSIAFVFDLIALAPLIIAALVLSWDSTVLPFGAMIGAAFLIGCASFAALYLLPWASAFAAKVIVRIWRGAFGQRLNTLLTELSREFLLVQRAGLTGKLFLLSLGVRITKYGALYVFLYALLSPLGYNWNQLPFSKVFLGICAAELAASLPISGIAGFGLYEGTWALVFKVLGFPATIATITAVSHHLLTQLYGYALGCAALLVLFVMKPRSHPSPVPGTEVRPEPGKFYQKFGGVTATTVVLCWCILFVWQGNSVEAEPVADKPSSDEQKVGSELAQHVRARVVFDSRRKGNFGIYSIKLDGSDEQRYVDTAMHEMYPDSSPDGKLVAYAASHSTMRDEPGEIWLYSVADKTTRKLASNGTFPTFSADGKSVYFEREQKKLMRIPIEGGKAEVLLPKASPSFRPYMIVKPRVSPDGRLAAFTSDRNGKWNTFYVNLENGEYRHIAHGCEPTWFPDSNNLAWIKKQDTKERSGIFKFEPSSKSITTLHDADKPWGHEYFPTISSDGSYLLYSAAGPGEHDHITSSYQVHIKSLKSGETARVTFDGHNSRWPKLQPTLE